MTIHSWVDPVTFTVAHRYSENVYPGQQIVGSRSPSGLGGSTGLVRGGRSRPPLVRGSSLSSLVVGRVPLAIAGDQAYAEQVHRADEPGDEEQIHVDGGFQPPDQPHHSAFHPAHGEGWV